MARLFFAIFLMMSALPSFSQSKAVTVSYSFEMKIPEKIKQIENEQIRKLAIQKMQEKSQEYTMYFHDGLYGFSALSEAFQGKNFIVGGERSVFLDMKKRERVSQEGIMDKKFIVKELFATLTWTIGKETKVILGKTCLKAITHIDKMPITAWFCEEIPIQIGPAGYCGLPGLIMEIESGSFVYSARKVEYTASILKITPPSKGEVLSREEFIKLREKKMKEIGVDPKHQPGGIQIIKM